MMRFQHSGHLIRVAMVFLAGSVLFFFVRGFVVPHSFGKYGHYRADSLGEIATRPVSYAGRETCAGCHDEVATQKSKGKHANVDCEACHGPLAKHADEPGSLVPVKPDTAVLCVRCHEANGAKPAGFPQVVSKEHAGDVACGSCHHPHQPKIGGAS